MHVDSAVYQVAHLGVDEETRCRSILTRVEACL